MIVSRESRKDLRAARPQPKRIGLERGACRARVEGDPRSRRRLGPASRAYVAASSSASSRCSRFHQTRAMMTLIS
jgi:hypothetical protein